MNDLLIRGARVYDGLGNPGRDVDVAVRDGRIVPPGETSAPARKTVDAGGLALMPGIVDIHTHYDAQITWDRTLSPSPSLGVTTVIAGNCGFGIAPCPAPLRQTVVKNLSVVEGMDLDALLTGRPFSANVGRSVLFGMAAAGWAVLAYMAAQPAFGSRVPRISQQMLNLAFAERGWLGLLLNEPASAFFLCTLGLLVPLMLANRFIAQRRLRRGAVLALSFIGASIAGLDFARPWTVWYVALCSVLLLSSFWVGDFLAAVVAINLFGVSHAVLALSSVIGGWFGTALLIMLVALFTAIFALAATYKGRWLADADVRPKYAERLMERLELQAEVAAAREAQLRLLPAHLPEVPGFSLAASCTPAREVGGDFYDFFPLGSGRLGILVAEGGSTGLASALSIGLAKGFLLHAATHDWAPGEALRRLRPVLGRAVKGTIERLGLGYAILDPHACQLRFARFGQHPRLLECAPGQPPRDIEILGRAEADFVGERTIALAPGTTLVLATDGIDTRLQRRGVAPNLAHWLANRSAIVSAAALQADLLQQAGAGDADLNDDLTVVILRCEAAVPAAREGVA